MAAVTSRVKFRALFESLEQRTLLSAMTFTVNDVNDAGAGSLRAAITAANANVTGPNTIKFKIPGVGTHAIFVKSKLPAITSPTTIDGTSEPDFSGTPVIRISGSELTTLTDGLEIAGAQASGTVIRSLKIVQFSGSGIASDGASELVIAGNYLGNNGVQALGDGTGIFLKQGRDIRIGGTTAADRNIISGNGNAQVQTNEGISNLVIEGNYVGLNAAGTSAIQPRRDENGQEIYGLVLNDPTNCTVGGTVTGARNVISGNGEGIIAAATIDSTVSIKIEGNYIGTDVTGTKAIPNDYGVNWLARNTSVLGGTTSSTRNIISGNTFAGILVGTSSGPVEGNYVGTDVSGSVAIPNGEGITLQEGPTAIGGTVAGSGNLISGNKLEGIEISNFQASGGSKIEGNFIGTAVGGTKPLPNGAAGISIAGPNNIIGGSSAAANVIAFNNGAGVEVVGSTAIHNSIRFNSIHNNDHLGIDLSPTDNADGVTNDDAHDPDTGGNGLQNFPLLMSAVRTSSFTSAITIKGTLPSLANTRFTIDFYANTAKDPSGFGEGQVWIGSEAVTTNAAGIATFTAVISKSVVVGSYVSATATLARGGDTSEFSNDVIVTR